MRRSQWRSAQAPMAAWQRKVAMKRTFSGRYFVPWRNARGNKKCEIRTIRNGSDRVFCVRYVSFYSRKRPIRNGPESWFVTGEVCLRALVFVRCRLHRIAGLGTSSFVPENRLAQIREFVRTGAKSDVPLWGPSTDGPRRAL